MKNKIVVAYSGGLDTSVMVTWLKEKYHADIIACIVDIGQKEDFGVIRRRAMKTGALRAYVINAREEFIKDYVFPALKANAVYENKYLLGTALARPLIAKKVIDIAYKEDANIVSHGATGKGNDQVRFEISFRVLKPGIEIIAPWREWELESREDEIAYARKHKIDVPVSVEKPFSMDGNLWHISYEGGILEDLTQSLPEDMFHMTVPPDKAPQKPTTVEIDFEHGVPVKIDGREYSPAEIVDKLNGIGGRNSIGRVDIVENRLVGIKARNIYECPGGTILHAAHRVLESLVLERETMHYKQSIAERYAELVYYGLWYSPLRKAFDGFIETTQKHVTGSVKLKLYKGNISILSRKSPYSLYSEKLATFGKSDYDHKDSKGFIKLFGLPLEVESLLRQNKDASSR